MKRTLFEYDKWVKVENSTALFHSLKSIWRQRNFTDLTDELEENEIASIDSTKAKEAIIRAEKEFSIKFKSLEGNNIKNLVFEK